MARPEVVNLEMMRGATLKLRYTHQRYNDAGVKVATALTGATIQFTATAEADDADGDAWLLKSTANGGIVLVDDADDNKCDITIAAADTASKTAPAALYYDLRVQEADGTVSFPVAGRLDILAGQTN